jgi:tetratricopeptide (TPR) repeat protein
MVGIAGYYMNYSRYDEMKELYNHALEIREELDPTTEMYIIDGAGAWLRGDLEGQYWARRRFTDLYRTKRANYEIGLIANWINRPKEAIEKLKTFTLDDSFVKDWAGYWTQLTWAYHMLGQHKKELKEARRGRELLPERSSGLRNELRALSALGKIDDINRVIEESYEFPPPQSWTPGSLMYLTGVGLRAHGYPEDSFQMLNRALKWYEDRPQEERRTPTHRAAIARIFYHLEKWEESYELFKGLYKEQPDSLTYLGCLGVLSARMGDKEEATKIAEELKNLDRPYLHGRNTYWQSRIVALLGDKELAIELIRDSLAEGRTYNILHWEMDYEGLEDYPPFVELKKPKG